MLVYICIYIYTYVYVYICIYINTVKGAGRVPFQYSVELRQLDLHQLDFSLKEGVFNADAFHLHKFFSRKRINQVFF